MEGVELGSAGPIQDEQGWEGLRSCDLRLDTASAFSGLSCEEPTNHMLYIVVLLAIVSLDSLHVRVELVCSRGVKTQSYS